MSVRGAAIILILVLCLPACSRQGRIEKRLRQGAEYVTAREFEKARVTYLGVMQADPRNFEAIKRLGIIYQTMGASLEAARFLTGAKEMRPEDLDVRESLAKALLALGQKDAAKSEAEFVLSRDAARSSAWTVLAETAAAPEEIKALEARLQPLGSVPEPEPGVLLAQASVAMKRNDPSAAGAIIEKLLKRDLELHTAHFALGVLAMKGNDLARAEAAFARAAELEPRSGAGLAYAQLLQQQPGRGGEATKYLEQLSSKAPDYLPLWLFQARAALAAGDTKGASKALERIFPINPNNFEARLMRGQIFVANGETDKAIELFKSLSADPVRARTPQPRFELARAYLLKASPQQAIAALEEAIKLNPDFTEAILLLAQVQLQQGEPARAVEGTRNLLQKHPNMVPAQLLLAEAYRAAGRPDDAASVLREQIKANPKSAQAYLLLGVLLRQQNKLAEARSKFEKVLELEPDNRPGLFQLVDLDIQEKKFDAALVRVRDFLQKEPNLAVAKFLEARIHVAQGDWDKAEAALLKTLEMDPNFTRAYELLVSTYVFTNKLDSALGQVQERLAKNPENAQALMTAALIHEKKKDYPKAREAYEGVLAKYPDFAPALNNQAYLLAEQLNDSGKAYELAQKARTLRPADPAIADTLGWIFFKRGEYQQALTLLQESASRLPDIPEVQHHLGMASYRMGQEGAARAAFETAVGAPDDFPGKDESRRMLALLRQESEAAESRSSAQWKERVSQQPDDVVAWLRLGEAYEKEVAHPEAEQAYAEALKLNPKLLPAALKLAELYAGPLKSPQKAMEFAKKAKEIAPNEPKPAAMLGRLAYQSGNFTWAYSLLQDASRALPDNAEVQYDFAWAAYSLGKVNEARQAMQRVLNTGAGTARSNDAKTFLATIALEQSPQELAGAEPQLARLLEADPGYTPARMARAALQAQRGDVKPAMSTYADILRRWPEFAPAQKRLAGLYLEDKTADVAKAYELAIKARQKLPDDPELARILGEISYKRKEFTYAIQLLQESSRKMPLEARHLYFLGMSQIEARDRVQGRESLTRALDAGLHDPHAAEAKRVLADLQKK